MGVWAHAALALDWALWVTGQNQKDVDPMIESSPQTTRVGARPYTSARATPKRGQINAPMLAIVI